MAADMVSRLCMREITEATVKARGEEFLRDKFGLAAAARVAGGGGGSGDVHVAQPVLGHSHAAETGVRDQTLRRSRCGPLK
eukprot:2155642-Pyramimonas_sp.AAC.1